MKIKWVKIGDKKYGKGDLIKASKTGGHRISDIQVTISDKGIIEVNIFAVDGDNQEYYYKTFYNHPVEIVYDYESQKKEEKDHTPFTIL